MNTLGNNNLQAALIEVADMELEVLESFAESSPHEFSEDFLRKIDRVIKMSNYSYSTFGGRSNSRRFEHA